MSQGISFSGLGSGLDTDGIISQLIDIERRPISLIQRQQVTLEQQKGALNSINSSMVSLLSAAESLATDDVFSIVSANSDDSGRVSVNATNEAAAGNFSVEVVELAQSRRLSSGSFSSLSNSLNISGEFVINGQGVEIDDDDDLLDIRDKINSADAGVTAQLLTVSTGDSRLILTADEVGSDGFSIQDASSTNVLQGLGFTSSGTDIKNAFANGGRSGQFLASDEAVGTLLGLSEAPTGTVTIGDAEVAIDLVSDSLDDIRDKINAAAPTDVTATVSSSDVDGITRFQLEIAGTTNFADDSGILESVGVLASGGSLADSIVSGAESDKFVSTTTAVGSLLGLANGSTGTIQVGGESISVNIAEDSLTDIQTKINDAAPAGVTATIINTSDEEGNAQFQLRIDGTADLVDSGNVLESIGVLVGSNNAFESVGQVLTSNAQLLENAVLIHDTVSGAKTNELASDADIVGGLISSTAAGTVTIGDAEVEIDLASDSLNDIRDKINAAAPTGVTATVNATGPATFELEIDGTANFVDDGGVLNALGVIEDPTAIDAETRFSDIFGAGVQAGDTISISGTNKAGDQVSSTFTISSGNIKVQNLLRSVERAFGSDATASVDSSGRIVLRDDEAGASELTLELRANNEGDGNLALGAMARTTTGVDARSAELQAGQDSLFRINGIELSRSTNTITDAVQGVTLDLLEAEEGQLVEITVNKDDTSALRENISSFVDSFNTAMSLLNEQYTFDEASQSSGPLAGDSTILSIQTRLRSIVTSQISGLDEGFNALVLVGINFDRNGHLQVDDERLTEALNENLEDVRKLFVAQGSSSDKSVEFVSSNSNTRPGNYSVEVAQNASRASLLSRLEVNGNLAEDQLLDIVDKVTGKPAKIELKAGSSLDDIVSKVNAELSSEVAEVRRASIANTLDGNTALLASTAFADIFGAGTQDGDTIRVNGTTHDGDSVSRIFSIDDATTTTVGDLLSEVRSMFGGQVSASVDAEGRIVVADNQLGNSDLTLTLIEQNEGGGSLNFGSIEVETEGRLGLDITAVNKDNRLSIEHNGFGGRNGFSLGSDIASLGLSAGEFAGKDVQGTIDGQEADGFGRILTGKIGADNVEGLSLRVDMDDDELATEGAEQGNVDLVFGVGRLLTDELKNITDAFDGTIKNRGRAIDDTIDDLDGRVADMERRVEQKRLNLVGKFASLEGTLATLQSQGNFLSSQLAGLSR
jgi:flagellar hook-associated protein 2